MPLSRQVRRRGRRNQAASVVLSLQAGSVNILGTSAPERVTGQSGACTNHEYAQRVTSSVAANDTCGRSPGDAALRPGDGLLKIGSRVVDARLQLLFGRLKRAGLLQFPRGRLVLVATQFAQGFDCSFRFE